MGTIDQQTLIRLVFGYKHLWLKYQELRYMAKHPRADLDEVRQAVFDEIEAVFSPVTDALSAGLPDPKLLQGLVDTIERAKELPLR